jgi:hypothetical protein
VAIYIGDNAILVEETNGSNTVLECRGVPLSVDRVCGLAGTSAGNSGSSAGEWTNFNANYNYNAPSGSGFSSGRFTAAEDGHYLIYTWFMANSSLQNNKNYRIRVNNASTNQQVYIYSSNGSEFREMEGSSLLYLTAGDFVSIYIHNVELYGTSVTYTRFCVTYLG